LKDRLIRLGIPVIVFNFVLSPIANLGLFLMPASLTGFTTPLTWDVFWRMYPDLIGLGPMWFVVMLLVFSIGYIGWRLLKKNGQGQDPNAPTPGYLSIGIFILILAVASFLVRIVIPIGKMVSHFPTLAYLPQYLSFFVLGTIAYRRDWFRKLSGRMGVIGFVTAMAATFFLFSIGFISFLKAIDTGAQEIPPFGFGTWQSAVYVLWDSIFAVGLVLAAITFFRRFLNKESRLGSFMAQQSYAVYIIHIPIIVFMAYLLRGFVIAPLLKFGLASVIIVTICFLVAALIRKIPGFSRVL
jgi:surface polysaccharide O-acyltransferase-like enzyme